MTSYIALACFDPISGSYRIFDLDIRGAREKSTKSATLLPLNQGCGSIWPDPDPDPDFFQNPDPDPSFKKIRIRIQAFGKIRIRPKKIQDTGLFKNPDPDPDPGFSNAGSGKNTRIRIRNPAI